MDLDLQKLYLNKEYQKESLLHATFFSYKLWSESPVINNLPRLIFLWEKQQLKEISLQEFAQQTLDFVFNWLADTIRLITVFENIFKADLINKGFVIHEVDKESSGSNLEKSLWAKQQNGPLPLEHILQYVSERTPLGLTINTLLSDRTIGFSKMINNKKYIQALGLPTELCKFLKRVNSYRNTLHFVQEPTWQVGDDLIKHLTLLNQFIHILMEREGFSKKKEGVELLQRLYQLIV